MGIEIVVALAAIFIAVWQAKLSRTHNRLSVKPHLQFDYHITQGKNENVSVIDLKIKNAGIGPAFVNDFAVYVKGKRQENFSYEQWFDVLTDLGFRKHYDDVMGYEYGKGDAISSKEVEPLLLFSCEDDSYHELLKKLSIEIKYEDAYGQKFIVRYH